jgi:hypothetical protein
MQGLVHRKEQQGLTQVQKSMLFVGYGVATALTFWLTAFVGQVRPETD